MGAKEATSLARRRRSDLGRADRNCDTDGSGPDGRSDDPRPDRAPWPPTRDWRGVDPWHLNCYCRMGIVTAQVGGGQDLNPGHMQVAVDAETTLRDYLLWEVDHAQRSLRLFGHALTPAERESQVETIQRVKKVLADGAVDQQLRRHLYEFRRRPAVPLAPLAPTARDEPLTRPIQEWRSGAEGDTRSRASG
jgi:hypothetical protein